MLNGGREVESDLKLHFKEEADGWPLLVLLGPWRTLVLEGTVSHDEGPRGYIHVCPHLSFFVSGQAPQWNSEVELMASEFGFGERIVTFFWLC